MLPALLAGWIALDLHSPRTHSLRAIDGSEVGALETSMWRSYYGHQPVRLFVQLSQMLRRQYSMPFWSSCLGAWHAARAAVAFQKGRDRAGYELALPDLESFYTLIRRGSRDPFDTRQAARAELEWWIIHRERARYSPGELERSLAELQAHLYRQPGADFADHARLRAEAMLLRDRRAEAGGVREQDWTRIGTLLDGSWSSLERAVAAAPASTAASAR